MDKVLKIVASRLTQQTNKISEHPDSNLLSAFVEQSLGNRERAQVLEHLASCFDCREAVLLSAPEVVVAASGAQVTKPRFAWPVLRWGTAIACVVVVGAAVSLHQREKQESALSSHSSDASLAQVQKGSQIASAQQPSKAVPSVATPATPIEQFEPQLKTKALQAEVTSSDAPRRDVGTLADAERSEKKAANEASNLTADNRIDSMVPGRAKDALDANPASANAAPAPMSLEKAVGVPLTPAVAIPSNRVPRWTLTDGVLERSLDSGRSWASIPVANGIQFRALAANGLDIWAGGVNGALYHSGDAGQHWTQVQPTWNGHTLTADILGVEFTDLQHGKLSTSSGEIWTTEDAGATWVQH
jgi:hypothetical protein